MKKEKIENFLNNLSYIYNNKDISLKEKTRQEIIKQYKKLENGSTNLAYASYALYPYIKEESYAIKDEKFHDFLKLLEKNKWKAYFGMVLGSAFAK
ncbi:MAG: hypothetical protein PUG67_05540 [Peptoniphilaceae bacterium]|nr:hypothetical protein [Peptoniphilaceae bacterium]MDY6018816.1 hypothetical protein [Anaerococcus sp.]